jgi:hypothetical protein
VAVLTYDESLGGYPTNITEHRLKAAPKYSDESSWNWSDQSETKVNKYYGSTFV